MKIGIHNKTHGFTPRWIQYCQENNIPYQLVNCYANDIIEQLKSCDALMWHHSHSNPKDIIIAKQILFALEQTGFVVFPNFNTGWHFDDKVGQKYLFERLQAPFIKSSAFYDMESAIKWANETNYPKVFKLRGGAGSANVRLVNSRNEAVKIIKKAFSSGFRNFDSWSGLKERWRKFRIGKGSLVDLAKGFVRLFYAPHYDKVMGREIGYVYFQDFIPNNEYDTRIIVIDEKAFGLRRYVRANDFRASGSGNFGYDKDLFDERCIQLAFELYEKLDINCAAYDFVFDESNNPLVIELSYGFSAAGYDDCPGYWDKDLRWHEGRFNPQGWMVESVVKEIRRKAKVE